MDAAKSTAPAFLGDLAVVDWKLWLLAIFLKLLTTNSEHDCVLGQQALLAKCYLLLRISEIAGAAALQLQHCAVTAHELC